VQQYKIDEDADIKALVSEVNQKIAAKRDSLRQKMDLTPEEQKIIDEEVGALGSLDMNPDTRNLIPVESIKKCHAALSVCSMKIREIHEKEFVPKRI